MSVDLEAIAQRGRCDVSSLRLALPLLEQGYTPPFLARYRRDELGGLDEANLWALAAAMRTQQQVAERREELYQAWQQTPLADPSIGHAIKKANSARMLARLSRRLKGESPDRIGDPTRLAVRVLNPQRGDSGDPSELAQKVEGIEDTDAAVNGLDAAIAHRLAGDPRMIAAAVRWLAKHARIHIVKISDPHTGKQENAKEGEDEQAEDKEAENKQTDDKPSADKQAKDGEAPSPSADTESKPAAETAATEPEDPAKAEASAATGESAAVTENESTHQATQPTAASRPPASSSDAESSDAESSGAPDPGGSGEKNSNLAKDNKPAKDKEVTKAPKKQKKISPRQRRRRWLVGVLKPLQGKRLSGDKLSAFQIVMLGRALRSQVAECLFEYDATKLVAELQRVAGNINRHFDHQLKELVLEHEANIREAAETAWWDDLHERASTRLVTITADHLRRHVNRGAVEANVIMAIDAVGPRTAAASIVASDGRLLHSEDLPCQLSAATRSQAVARMGELIHSWHIDLLVISNGPARRAVMIALNDLIGQSPEASVRWTLADRGGADAYASSDTANEEMRSTPRRFRAAAWLAFSVLQPAQALAKVDPLKLRLSSFQRELSDDAMRASLEDVMTSGASRGGVDVNSAPVSWLQRLPGVAEEVATAIDSQRRTELFPSRQAVAEMDAWDNQVNSRQAIPFLRVFGSEEPLDGTLIHPDDYALARKLADALEIEPPPSAPEGYQPPDFSASSELTEPAKLTETETKNEPIAVEDFTAAGEKAREFALDAPTESEPKESESSDGELNNDESNEGESGEASAAKASEPDAPGEGESASSESAEAVATETTNDATAQTDKSKAERPPAPEVAQRVIRPRPEKAKIDKCIKEWQIGANRANQLVQWLCDPFGDSDSTDSPPAVLTTMPATGSLKEGDRVIGVVVGVMPFGVFVELAPDCSGLIHVSRISESYVEDLHEAVQVGDVVTAWVTGIDQKRRRVALSAVSPERAAELEEARRTRSDRGPRGGGRQRGASRGRAGGPAAERDARSGGASQAKRGGGPGSGGGRGDGPRGGGGRGRDSRGGGRGREARGGRGRDTRGKGRSRKPESYRVAAEKESRPLTDAMQKGDEPLRSFGDLMQFFDKSKTEGKPEPPKSKKPAAEPSAGKSPTDDHDDSGQEASGDQQASSGSKQETTGTTPANKPAAEPPGEARPESAAAPAEAPAAAADTNQDSSQQTSNQQDPSSESEPSEKAQADSNAKPPSDTPPSSADAST